MKHLFRGAPKNIVSKKFYKFLRKHRWSREHLPFCFAEKGSHAYMMQLGGVRFRKLSNILNQPSFEYSINDWKIHLKCLTMFWIRLCLRLRTTSENLKKMFTLKFILKSEKLLKMDSLIKTSTNLLLWIWIAKFEN